MKDKRLGELKTWLALYQSIASRKGYEIEFIPNAGDAINDLYWATVDRKVRARLEEIEDSDQLHTIDRHKIISVTEGCIMQIKPIKASGLVAAYEKQREANAIMALAFGQNILLQWANEQRDLDAIDFSDLKDEAFEREHVSWLCQVDTEGSFPIFSNSATWYMYEKYLELKLRN